MHLCCGFNDGVRVESANGSEFHSNDGCISVYLDGFLQNRDSLAAELGLPPDSVSTITDAQLIARVYGKWGENSSEYLLGEFACVVVDRTASIVLGIRDSLGIKPFFYQFADGQFTGGSDLDVVVSLTDAPKQLCDKAVAQFLREGGLYHHHLTFYEGVKKLPPGHCLKLDDGAITIRSYWHPADVEPLVLPAEQDYVKRLRELLHDAVKVRVEGSKRVGMHLSGGLDSSVITAIAAPLLQKMGAPVDCFSWLAPPLREEKNSREWSSGRAVAEAIGAQYHYTNFSEKDFSDILCNHNLARHDTVNLWYEHRVREEAGQLGIEALLSGWGGDQFISNYGRYRYIDTLLHDDPIDTLRDLYQSTAGQSLRLFHFVSRCYNALLLPSLPRRLVGRRGGYYQPDFLGAATGEFAEFARRQEASEGTSRPRSIRADQLAHFETGHLHSRLESWAVAGQRAGIEYRYPLLDRRIVEFALGLPAELYHRRGVTRYLFRRVAQDLVPNDIWARNVTQETQRIKLLAEICRQSLKSWREGNGNQMESNRYIDVGRLNSLIDRVTAKDSSNEVQDLLDITTAVNSILVLNIDVSGCSA